MERILTVCMRGDQLNAEDDGQAERRPMARRGVGTKGKKVQLYTNHFNVNISNTVLLEEHLYQYRVAITYGDGYPVVAKGVGLKIMNIFHQTYKYELAGKDLASDGENTLFTVGSLPHYELEFDVVLGACDYKVAISYATKTPLLAIAAKDTDKESEEVVRALNIILRQNAAKGGLLFNRSFFHNQPHNFFPIEGGLVGCRGFHSSFRATQGALSLNIDVSTTTMLKPGPVIDFLLANQNVPHVYNIDWEKAKKTLKNLRITASPLGQEHKILGLSNKICRDQTFKLKNTSVEVTVYDYFVSYKKILLRYSGELPCIIVGKPKRPVYFPVELCDLASLQRYKKSLTNLQRASLVEKSRMKPLDRMKTLTNALSVSNYNADRLLASCGISIDSHSTRVEGRVLPAPKLKLGDEVKIKPLNGKWSFNWRLNEKVIGPVAIRRWAVLSFGTPPWSSESIKKSCEYLSAHAKTLGIPVTEPLAIVIEEPRFCEQKKQ